VQIKTSILPILISCGLLYLYYGLPLGQLTSLGSGALPNFFSLMLLLISVFLFFTDRSTVNIFNKNFLIPLIISVVVFLFGAIASYNIYYAVGLTVTIVTLLFGQRNFAKIITLLLTTFLFFLLFEYFFFIFL